MKRWVFFWTLAISVPAFAGGMALSVPLIDRGTGTLYVEGKIGSQGPVSFLLDTGSSFSTIDQAMLERLQRQGEVKYLRTQAGMLANGARIEVPLYRVRHLQIGKRCTVPDIEVAVFPHNKRVILGLNVLSRISPFEISVDPPRLSMTGCEVLAASSTRRLEPSLAILPQKAR